MLIADIADASAMLTESRLKLVAAHPHQQIRVGAEMATSSLKHEISTPQYDRRHRLYFASLISYVPTSFQDLTLPNY